MWKREEIVSHIPIHNRRDTAMKKRLITLALSIALLVALCVPAALATSQDRNRLVNQPYEYPVKAGSDEWYTLMDDGGYAAVVTANHVDEELLASMTTPALVETVMSYPLLGSPLAFNSGEQWMKSISDWGFKGIDILLVREDALECTEEYFEGRMSVRSGEDLRGAERYLAYKVGIDLNAVAEVTQESLGVAPRAIG